MKILVADDDTDLADVLTLVLQREGYATVVAHDGQEALERWADDDPDLVLLDVHLPNLDGLTVCRRVRESSRTPVIIMSGRDAEADILRGFDAGADDYVVKPFSSRQLASRIAAVLRRTHEAHVGPVGVVKVGDLVLNAADAEVFKGGQPLHLTRLEFRLLYLLARNVGRTLPYEQLVQYAWAPPGEGSIGLLKVHLTHIRRKLGIHPGDRGGIRAIRGLGYRLDRNGHAPEHGHQQVA